MKLLTFCICSATNVHHVYQSIRMPQIVKELIPKSFSLMCPRDQSSNIKEFDRHRPPPTKAGSIVRFASIGDVEPGAGARYLEVANSSLRIDGGETAVY